MGDMVVNMESNYSHWEKTKSEVLGLTDKLGKPVDAGIVDAVTAFRAIGLATSASCEGHLDWGARYPWIAIQIGGDLDRTMFHREDFMEVECYLLHLRLVEMLEEFYQDRKCPYPVKLIPTNIGSESICVMPVGGEASRLSPGEHLEAYQAEFEALTGFIMQRYLAPMSLQRPKWLGRTINLTRISALKKLSLLGTMAWPDTWGKEG